MGEKTKAELKKELEVTKREQKWANDKLMECQAKNRGLSADIEKANTGWTIAVREQIRRGSYTDLKAIAKQLIDNGFWFFELRKD